MCHLAGPIGSLGISISGGGQSGNLTHRGREAKSAHTCGMIDSDVGSALVRAMVRAAGLETQPDDVWVAIGSESA